jgi:hypothetical protein
MTQLKQLSEKTPQTVGHLDRASIEPKQADHALVLRCEELFATIRLSRALARVTVDEQPGAIVDFPTFVVVDGVVADLHVTSIPGFFAEGHHTVIARGVFGSIAVTGRFEIGVGEAFGISPATWTGSSSFTGMHETVPATLEAMLPKSVQVPIAPSLLGAIRRAHLQAQRAKTELLRLNGGLVRSVVNRFRGVVRTESALIDLKDLVAVGEQQLLEVADRYFTDPEQAPVRTVAWSKLVQRAIGNALRTEIARVTGISVEFRQLLSWYHSHPEDRDQPAEFVARRMAFAAGVTRLMSARAIHDRAAAHELLETMLELGDAAYVVPGRDANEVSQQLRSAGIFVISSRSSLAEIDRARVFQGTTVPHLATEEAHEDRNTFLSVIDPGYEVAELLDAVRQVIEKSKMTPLEAAVWLHRTGTLDPGGHPSELPDIAVDLGLKDRSEARSALRRARRKLDALSADSQEIFNSNP